jgi:hypothetical protein
MNGVNHVHTCVIDDKLLVFDEFIEFEAPRLNVTPPPGVRAEQRTASEALPRLFGKLTGISLLFRFVAGTVEGLPYTGSRKAMDLPCSLRNGALSFRA